MVFCNMENKIRNNGVLTGHNPYFNRWFSAIEDKEIKTYNLLGSQSLF